ncbi:hypothetical protein [Bacillus taeanensis]|uniref:Uncharacterized protein n=1 Tax=Bacillus taeanensis TaxID=273032 RepID=A0A366XYC4_9BACI|nr:hypothetical protein [Bacillus taeanensis]RBW70897.1 hypothetical protein DS031_02540 [Bacillus taeanensis]
MQNKDLEKWIENDYKGEEGMPAVGDEILTKPGMTTGPVLKEIEARIEKGKNIAICVVIDNTGIQGRDTVEVKGFAAFEISEVVHNGIKGKFIDYVDSKGLLSDNEFSVVDYGVHTINLIE